MASPGSLLLTGDSEKRGGDETGTDLSCIAGLRLLSKICRRVVSPPSLVRRIAVLDTRFCCCPWPGCFGSGVCAHCPSKPLHLSCMPTLSGTGRHPGRQGAR